MDVGDGAGDFLSQRYPCLGVSHRLDRAIGHLVQNLGIAHFIGSRPHQGLALKQAEQGKQQKPDDNPNGKIAELIHVDPRFLEQPPRRIAPFTYLTLNIGCDNANSKSLTTVNLCLLRLSFTNYG